MPRFRNARSAIGRRRIGRQVHHQAIDKNPHPDLQGLSGTAVNHLHQRAGQTKEQQDVGGTELIAAQQPDPCQEHRRYDYETVAQDNVPIVSRSGDIDFADSNAEDWGGIRYGRGHGFLQQAHGDAQAKELQAPMAGPSCSPGREFRTEPPLKESTADDPEQIQTSHHTEQRSQIALLVTDGEDSKNGRDGEEVERRNGYRDTDRDL